MRFGGLTGLFLGNVTVDVPLPSQLKDQVRATWASEIKNASGQPVLKQ